MHWVHLLHFVGRGRGWIVLPLMLAPAVVLSIAFGSHRGGEPAPDWPVAVGFLLSAPLIWGAGWLLDLLHGTLVIDEARPKLVRLPGNDTLLGIRVRDWAWIALLIGLVGLVQ